MKMRLRALTLVLPMLAATIPFVLLPGATAIPDPVATDEPTYQALGRVFPDPHGCLAYGVPDLDEDGVKDTPTGVSPWAKGRACADQFLSYQEVIDGSRFLQARFPEFLKVIRLDEAYDNPNYVSAGLPRNVLTEDGNVKFLGRDRRPLYLLKVTDSTSTVPESERQHFAYSLSIHGIERAGVEGGVRAMEDLVTWAACELPKYNSGTLPAPACADEGPFPKKIVESESTYAVPTAGEVVDNAVIYFVLPNPDGWGRGQVAPVEVEDGTANTNYVPGVFFQRYNGNGVDVNRDWPTKGYTYKPYSPGSEPETKAFGEVLTGIRATTDDNRFDGGIDLHGMVTAHAFSYTLLGAGQKDYVRNELTVETAIRTWEDQTRRIGWSAYVADKNANGQVDGNEVCTGEGLSVPNVYGGGTRGRIPACVADEWGTVIDTIGYQITGGIGDWIESPIGLDAIGIDNEMYGSHLAPNTVFDPQLEQTHIDGNKGLIFSQISALLTAGDISYDPPGKIGYVFNPKRLEVEEGTRVPNPGLPAQNDIDTIVPCQSAAVQNLEGACGAGTWDAQSFALEFDVKGPTEGIWNGGLTVQITKPNASGMGDGNFFQMHLQHQHEGQWQTISSDFNQSFIYAQAGAIITANDPTPGRYRVLLGAANTYPMRVRIDFNPVTAEGSPGQAAIDASSMDFFDELNRYVPEGSEVEAIPVQRIVADPASLDAYDSIVVVNDLGDRGFLTNFTNGLGLAGAEADAYFASLKGFAERGGNVVLTDAALKAAAEFGLVAPTDVKRSTGLVGNYAFQIAGGNVTYNDPTRYPLTTGVKKPGTAEQQLGRRQAVEPAPLGYTPDTGMDGDPAMPFFGISKAAWQAACGLADCSSAATTSNGSTINLGEAALGQGRVRIAGVLLPNPVFAPDDSNDHRFGLADYSLTYTGWEVFKNVVSYNRG